ncbi:MAG: nucleoside deaminase [Bdellovibrio sp.]|nr:nucleoside deaminase [Bdellovibrio sp.]
MKPPSDWLNIAYLLAIKAKERDEVPVGALLVQEDKIIAKAHNLKESQQNPLAHAEILAISKAAKKLNTWRLHGLTLIVTLEPCLMCLAACQQARISKVIYGAKDHKGGALSLGYFFNHDKRLNHRFEAVFYDFKPSGKILSDFFKARRRV